MSLDAFVKLGGSLLESDVRPLLDALASLAATRRLAVLPGGGPFADAVRAAVHRHPAGDSAAHWMAILALDQHAHLLAGLEPRARLCISAVEVESALGDARLAVLAPYAWLRAADPLPHSWDVTSDSLAAWLAARLDARRLILMKSRDAPCDCSAVEAARSGLVDRHFPKALEGRQECWLLNGRATERLGELLSERPAGATRVLGG